MAQTVVDRLEAIRSRPGHAQQAFGIPGQRHALGQLQPARGWAGRSGGRNGPGGAAEFLFALARHINGDPSMLHGLSAVVKAHDLAQARNQRSFRCGRQNADGGVETGCSVRRVWRVTSVVTCGTYLGPTVVRPGRAGRSRQPAAPDGHALVAR